MITEATPTPDVYIGQLSIDLLRCESLEIIRWADLVYDAWQTGHTVFIFGNGGSATNASHISEDLGTMFAGEGHIVVRRLRVMSLVDNIGWITAIANDLGYGYIFSEQLKVHGRPDDLVIAISGSGNSHNVLAAVEWANDNGLKTFGLTGFSGGTLAQFQQAGFRAASNDTGTVESIHLAMSHWVLNNVRERILTQSGSEAS